MYRNELTIFEQNLGIQTKNSNNTYGKFKTASQAWFETRFCVRNKTLNKKKCIPDDPRDCIRKQERALTKTVFETIRILK